MKKIVLAIMLLTIIGIAAAAFAVEQNITLSTATVVNGTKLAPGDYILRYEIKGTTADVKILQGKKEVAVIKGVVIDKKDASPYNSIVRVMNADGTASITEIQMANKKQVIRLEGADTAVGK